MLNPQALNPCTGRDLHLHHTQGPHLYSEQFSEYKLYCFLFAKRNYKGTN